LRLFEFGFRWPLAGYAFRRGIGFVESAAQEAGRVEVEIEQIVPGLAIMRVERHGFFEALACSARVDDGEWRTAFRATSPGTAQPKFNFGTGRGSCKSLFEELGSFLVLAQHEIVLAGQQVVGGAGRVVLCQSTE